MEKHKNIYAALAAAQIDISRATKDVINTHFRSKYADLASVMDACMRQLGENGIAVTQPIESNEIGMFVKTVLTHGDSETSVECVVPLILGKNDMQGLGSAITYARRYGLMSMAGVAPDDDDGNAAVASAPKSSKFQSALLDAWRDGVLDRLPENATHQQKAQAFADAIVEGFSGKKQRALDNEWTRREKYITSLKSQYPELHKKVIEAYEAQQEKNDLDSEANRNE